VKTVVVVAAGLEYSGSVYTSSPADPAAVHCGKIEAE
jgi:hypothetical protein